MEKTSSDEISVTEYTDRTKHLSLTEILKKSTARIQITPPDDKEKREKARELVNQNPGHKAYVQLEHSPVYYFGTLKPILCSSGITIQLKGLNKTIGLSYETLTDLIIM